jgi:NO-binding membrane sensor protein with MHYT domain
MAIVGVFLAGLLWFLSTRTRDAQIGRILLGLAIAAVAFAGYLAAFEPQLAWDVHWVGRLVLRMFGAGFRHALH